MAVISVKVDSEEYELIQEYAKLKDVSVADFVRGSVMEKIENERDLDLYEQAMKEYEENPQSISLEDVREELS